jgi:hypothetical protein
MPPAGGSPGGVPSGASARAKEAVNRKHTAINRENIFFIRMNLLYIDHSEILSSGKPASLRRESSYRKKLK